MAVRWLALLGWIAAIWRTSATPGLKAVPLAQQAGVLPDVLGPVWSNLLEVLIRKSAHIFSFGLLALLGLWTLAGAFPRMERRRLFWAAFGLAAAYAVIDEVHQVFVPMRAGRWYDVLIDAAGAGLALLLVRMRRKG